MEKIKNGKKVVKAWAAARESEEDSSNIVKDSTTCTKESMRIILILLASNRRPCNAIDMKSAFRKGKKIERTVFLMTPPEFQE